MQLQIARVITDKAFGSCCCMVRCSQRIWTNASSKKQKCSRSQKGERSCVTVCILNIRRGYSYLFKDPLMLYVNSGYQHEWCTFTFKALLTLYKSSKFLGCRPAKNKKANFIILRTNWSKPAPLQGYPDSPPPHRPPTVLHLQMRRDQTRSLEYLLAEMFAIPHARCRRNE